MPKAAVQSPESIRLKALRWLPASMDDSGMILFDPARVVSRFDRAGRQYLRTLGVVSLRTREEPDLRVGGLDKMQSADLLGSDGQALGNIGLNVRTWDQYGPMETTPIPSYRTDHDNNLQIQFR